MSVLRKCSTEVGVGIVYIQTMWGRGSGLMISAIELTIELLQDSLHGTGAAATAHGNVEFVLMVRHDGLKWLLRAQRRVVGLLRNGVVDGVGGVYGITCLLCYWSWHCFACPN